MNEIQMIKPKPSRTTFHQIHLKISHLMNIKELERVNSPSNVEKCDESPIKTFSKKFDFSNFHTFLQTLNDKFPQKHVYTPVFKEFDQNLSELHVRKMGFNCSIGNQKKSRSALLKKKGKKEKNKSVSFSEENTYVFI